MSISISISVVLPMSLLFFENASGCLLHISANHFLVSSVISAFCNLTFLFG